MKKLYCYVDESGQDRGSEIFVVALVVTGIERDSLRAVIEKIEKETKGKTKWIKTRPALRAVFWERVAQESALKGKLFVEVYKEKGDFLEKTINASADTLAVCVKNDEEVVMVVDGLPQSQRGRFGAALRHRGIRVRKVRGVREESEPLARLVDMLAGLARAAYEGRTPFSKIYRQLVEKEVVREIKNPHG